MQKRSGRWNAECRWAWRNLRAQRWHAVLAVVLLATALAANVIVFAATDSLVFRRTLYREPDRLAQIASRRTPFVNTFASAAVLDQWRQQPQLFDSVQGFLTKVVFLTGATQPELVEAADVTPGLLETLGVRPKWGRTFDLDDARREDIQTVVLSELLARKRFGTPERAVGQTIETTDRPFLVVGVMDRTFRFPSGSHHLWRALDPRGPLAQGFAGVNTIVRLAPGVSMEAASRAVADRAAAVAREAGTAVPSGSGVIPLPLAEPMEETPRMYSVLLASALCLLLIACANVASLELAGTMARVRSYAVCLAVGASRASLARVTLIEGAYLIGAATALGLLLSYGGAAALANVLPESVVNATANPIDMDQRGFAYMVAVAAAAWLLASIPTGLYIMRTSLLDLLKLQGHGATTPGGTFIRRALTVTQIGLTVLLLVGSGLYLRSYRAMIGLEKGFDSSGVLSIEFVIPPQFLTSNEAYRLLARNVLDIVRAQPGVRAAVAASPPPSTGDSPMSINDLAVDDRPPENVQIGIGRKVVEREYFAAVGIPLRQGRLFELDEPATNVILPEPLARRLWPDGDAVGHRFRLGPRDEWYSVVGIVGHVRTTTDGTMGPSDRVYHFYAPRYPAPPPPPPPRLKPAVPARESARVVSAGLAYRFLAITARVDRPERAGELYRALRAREPRFSLEIESVDDVYARQFERQLLATRVISAFGVLAFALAAGGVYTLMTFLVTHRIAEIAVRMALGATPADVRRLILGSSLRLIGVGVALGLAGALAGARWARSQLFAVSPLDPLTLGGVTLVVVATAIVATWQPARQASRTDPRELMKA